MLDNHGANIYEIGRNTKINPKDLMDFSSNINPLGPSKKSLEYLSHHLDAVTTYPDSSYTKLKAAIGNYVDANPKDILLGCGTTELLREGIELLHPKKALIFAPCYSEYENELRNVESEIVYFPLTLAEDFHISTDKLIQQIIDEEIDLLIFANPNNPTGSILTREDIENILNRTNCFLIVDETYVEFTHMKTYSCVPLTKTHSRLFVTRGTSKFFATPGIRLGYAVTSSPELLHSFTQKELLWQINIFADLLGTVMFDDKEYIDKVFTFITSCREEILEQLRAIPGLRPVDSQGNFILVHIEDEHTAPQLRKILLKEGMIIRDCSNFHGLDEKYFRLCILDDTANKKLLQRIVEIFSSPTQ